LKVCDARIIAEDIVSSSFTSKQFVIYGMLAKWECLSGFGESNMGLASAGVGPNLVQILLENQRISGQCWTKVRKWILVLSVTWMNGDLRCCGDIEMNPGPFSERYEMCQFLFSFNIISLQGRS
jgi:hypothetical protein